MVSPGHGTTVKPLLTIKSSYLQFGYYWILPDSVLTLARDLINQTLYRHAFLPQKATDPISGKSNFSRLNYQGFYTVVLEKGDELISVASIRVHGVKVAEIPLIATCTEHRRQGMCRRLMTSIEEMLKSLKVELLVLSAIPDLVDTWISGFGYKHLEESERKQLCNVNLMSFPGTVMLRKTLYESKGTVKIENDSSPCKDLDEKTPVETSQDHHEIDRKEHTIEGLSNNSEMNHLQLTEEAVIPHMPAVNISSTFFCSGSLLCPTINVKHYTEPSIKETDETTEIARSTPEDSALDSRVKDRPLNHCEGDLKVQKKFVVTKKRCLTREADNQ